MKNTNKYKKLLEAEKSKLLKELATVGKRDPTSPNGWEAMENDLDSDSADENETADEMEELGENEAILGKLAPQLQLVEKALEKIKEGTYGKCDVCGEEIPEERLLANPSSLTCIKHTK
jgi:RNA polymerase-binding transcription factor DksA